MFFSINEFNHTISCINTIFRVKVVHFITLLPAIPVGKTIQLHGHRIWHPLDLLDPDSYEIERRNRNLSVTKRRMLRISPPVNYCDCAQVTKLKSPRDSIEIDGDFTRGYIVQCIVYSIMFRCVAMKKVAD